MDGHGLRRRLANWGRDALVLSAILAGLFGPAYLLTTTFDHGWREVLAFPAYTLVFSAWYWLGRRLASTPIDDAD